MRWSSSWNKSLQSDPLSALRRELLHKNDRLLECYPFLINGLLWNSDKHIWDRNIRHLPCERMHLPPPIIIIILSLCSTREGPPWVATYKFPHA